MRPSKDEYFLTMAMVVAQRASCPRRKVGCVLTDANGYVISTGYNGPPKNMPNCVDVPCGGQGFKSGEGLDKCKAIHAEANAYLQAEERGTLHLVENIYLTTGPSCSSCTADLLNRICSGQMPNVKRMVFVTKYPAGMGNVLKAAKIQLHAAEDLLDPTPLFDTMRQALGFIK